MFIVFVHIHVKPQFIEEFRKATIENARHSLEEPGIARFDFLQQTEDPTRFTLIEAYRNQDASAKHKDTAHYRLWRQTVSEMMTEPRTSVRFNNIYPEDSSWG